MKKAYLNIHISDRGRQLVHIDQFHVEQGKMHFLFGESGIGKTLLAKAVYGLLDPALLDVRMNGCPYRQYLRNSATVARQKHSFFVFQEPSSHLNPLRQIDRQLNEGRLAESTGGDSILKNLWPGNQGKALQDVLATYPKPYRPSGGEKQRILLTMFFKKLALLQKDQENLFVLDEPTGNLDNAHRNRVLDMLFEAWQKQPFTLLFITHDYTIINRLYSHHKNNLQAVRLTELQRLESGSCRLQSFGADAYLNWEQKLTVAPGSSDSHKEVLRFDSEFRVFNRPMTIYSDAQHRNKTDLCIPAGSLSYLKAPSGTGKTTLAKVLLGLQKAERFTAKLAGKRLNQSTAVGFWARHIWGRRCAMVFQHADESLNLKATVRQTFRALPVAAQWTDKQLLVKLNELFKRRVDLQFLQKRVGHLSGGQKQRINILRTLLLQPDLVILDEPLNGLDFESLRSVLEIVEQKRLTGTAFLVISHNEDIFDRLTPETLVYHLA